MKRTLDGSLDKEIQTEPIRKAKFVHIETKDAFGNTVNLMSVLNFPDYPIDMKKNYNFFHFHFFREFNSLNQSYIK